jgi:putative dimethyl sulfoxide reductase chaperone
MKLDKLLNRAECYRLLSICFSEPDRSWYDKEQIPEQLNHAFNNLNSPAKKYSRLMADSLTGLNFNDLLTEYSRLFLGPFKTLAPPYGSFYIDKGEQLMQESTVQVKNFYIYNGLQFSDDIKEIPDHITIELEFIYYLLYKEYEILLNDSTENAVNLIRSRREFFVNFFYLFAEKFSKRILESTSNEFYTNLARSLQAFIRSEYEIYFNWESRKESPQK